MRLEQQERNVEIIGQAFEKQSAKAELNPVIFQILSGKIYSNKILAVIRELACNAVDAHRMAGPNAPKHFDVQLPTKIEPVFRIRDYGVGLSHENVFNLYMTFGASAKRDSNSLIGGLGIGSKAPLAYTNAFNVSSYYNGEQRSYSVFIDTDGQPATMHVHTQPTSEPNGLEISVPVKEGDIRRFEEEATAVFRYFNPDEIYPNFLGVSVPPENLQVNYLFKNHLFGKRKSPHNNNTLHAVMGNIAYPIDTHQLGQLCEEENRVNVNPIYLVKNEAIDFFFKVGDLDIAASREALSYTPRTAKVLFNAILEAVRLEKDRIKDLFKPLKTLWEVASTAYEVERTSFLRSLSLRGLYFKGVSVDSRLYLSPNNSYQDSQYIRATHLTDRDIRRNLEKPIIFGFSKHDSFIPYDIHVVVVKDTSHMLSACIRTVWQDFLDNQWPAIQAKRGLTTTPLMLVVEPEDISLFLTYAKGCPTPIYLSKVKPSPAFIKQREVKEKVEKAKVSYKHIAFSENSFNQSYVTVNVDSLNLSPQFKELYVVSNRDKIVLGNRTFTVEQVGALLHALGSKSLAVIQQANLSRVLKATGGEGKAFISLQTVLTEQDSVIKKKVKEFLLDGIRRDELLEQHLSSYQQEEALRKLFRLSRDLELDKVFPKDYASLDTFAFNGRAVLRPKVRRDFVANLRGLAEGLLGPNFVWGRLRDSQEYKTKYATKTLKDYELDWSNINNFFLTYPMLRLIDREVFGQNTAHWQSIVKDYKLMVDSAITNNTKKAS